jgi:hypothetical protein
VKKAIFAMAAGAFLLGAVNINARDSILNSSSVSQKDGWNVFIHVDNRKAGGKIAWQDGAAIFQIPDCRNKGGYTVQLYLNTDALMVDRTYKVSFDLDSERSGPAEVHYLLAISPYYSFAKQAFKLEAGKKRYECVLTPRKVKDEYKTPRSIRFFLGDLQGGAVSIANVTVAEVK